MGCKFPKGKVAGRNESEPICSFVTYLRKPILWSNGEGQWMWDLKTESFHIFRRSSRDGM